MFIVEQDVPAGWERGGGGEGKAGLWKSAASGDRECEGARCRIKQHACTDVGRGQGYASRCLNSMDAISQRTRLSVTYAQHIS